MASFLKLVIYNIFLRVAMRQLGSPICAPSIHPSIQRLVAAVSALFCSSSSLSLTFSSGYNGWTEENAVAGRTDLHCFRFICAWKIYATVGCPGTLPHTLTSHTPSILYHAHFGDVRVYGRAVGHHQTSLVSGKDGTQELQHARLLHHDRSVLLKWDDGVLILIKFQE